MARARQYADRVNVIKMVKVNGRWPFARVVERNGRIIRDHVWVAGQDEHHSEGRYYLEWYEEGRRRRKPVESFDLVLPAARAKSIELSAAKAGLLTQPETPDAHAEPARLTMDAAIDQYLEYIRKHRSLRTYRTYRPVLHVHFRNSYAKTYVDEVDRSDILKFMSDLFDYGLVARTVYDRLVVVLQLFKRHGYKNLVERSDWPSYVETIRPIYEPEELAAMLEHADSNEAILIKFCLATGFRDREIRHVTWRDIDFRNCVVRITAKPVWKFKPKNYEERAVPVPVALIEQLRQLKEKGKAALSEPVFPNTQGKPDSLHIEIIKDVAYPKRTNQSSRRRTFRQSLQRNTRSSESWTMFAPRARTVGTGGQSVHHARELGATAPAITLQSRLRTRASTNAGPAARKRRFGQRLASPSTRARRFRE